MGVFHRATIVPGKAELIADWIPTQPWAPPSGASLDVIGSFRFDDPEGQVGIETHLVDAGGSVVQVPLTYRDAPLDDASAGFISEMEHSVLGTRWVYDAVHDPVYVTMLAAVTMTGQGEALGMAVYDGRWHIAPTNVRISGGGWTLERVPVDGFVVHAADDGVVALRNDRFEVTMFRRPTARPRPPLSLTATWDGQTEPVVLAEVRELAG